MIFPLMLNTGMAGCNYFRTCVHHLGKNKEGKFKLSFSSVQSIKTLPWRNLWKQTTYCLVLFHLRSWGSPSSAYYLLVSIYLSYSWCSAVSTGNCPGQLQLRTNDMRHFSFQSAYRKSIAWACGISAHIQTDASTPYIAKT